MKKARNGVGRDKQLGQRFRAARDKRHARRSVEKSGRKANRRRK